MPVPAGTPVIIWCGLCNAAPADGVLKILRTGHYVPEDVNACNDCVKGPNDDDWMDEP